MSCSKLWCLALVVVLCSLWPGFAAAADVAVLAVNIHNIQPTYAPADGKVVLTLYGVALHDPNLVTVGTVPAEILSTGYTRLRIRVPAGLAEGPQQVIVQSPSHGSSETYSLNPLFTVLPPGSLPGPAIESFSNPAGTSEGAEVCLEGRYFVEGAHVTFISELEQQSVSPEVTFHSTELLCALVPEHDNPFVAVVVVNPEGLEARLSLLPESTYPDPNCTCTTVKTTNPGPGKSTALALVLLGAIASIRRRRGSESNVQLP